MSIAVDYKALGLLLFVFIGAVGVVAAQEGAFFPIWLSALILLITGYAVFRLYLHTLIGPLTVLLFVAFALPFIHIFPYIWFDFDAEYPETLWGLVANAYMRDRVTIELMSMLGAIGAAGFVTGALLIGAPCPTDWRSQIAGRNQRSEATLPLPQFVVWVALAVAISWVAAPTQLVFEAAYTQSADISDDWNFPSVWMISYSILVFVFADSLFESSPDLADLKRKIVIGSTLFIVIWLQLLRGDRESLPLVLSMMLMYFAWGKHLRRSVKRQSISRWYVPAVLAIGIFLASYLVGALRYSLVDLDATMEIAATVADLQESGAIRIQDLISGTWSGALLTPLSVAGDHVRGLLPLKLGQDYADLIASILPGFVADWIGYTRPIDSLRGPAWEMTFGLGGTHAVVVPFMNFRMIGVFFVIALWAYLIGRLEQRSLKKLTIVRLSLLGTIAVAIPHWFWYGEKYIINAAIIWFLLSVLYRLHPFGKTDARS